MDALTDSDFARVMHSGADDQSFVKRGTTDDSGFRSLYFINKPYTAAQLEAAAKQAFAGEACGKIFRVKGFVRDGDGWLEFNATRQSTAVTPIAAGQDIVIVIGEQLNEAAVAALFG